MAIKPNESETFLREVDEELRKERLNQFAARYGWLIIAGVLLLLGAVGGYLWWQHSQQEEAGRQGSVLLDSLEAMEAGNDAAATAGINELVGSSVDGYRAAALFARATAETEAGNQAAATATLKSIADDTSLAEAYRQAALIRQTALEFDQLQPQAVISRLGPLARPGQAWFGTAGEMVGIAHLKMRRPDLAGPLFAQIGRDESVPPSIRTRAIQMAGSLGVDAIPEPTAQEGPAQGAGEPAATKGEAE